MRGHLSRCLICISCEYLTLKCTCEVEKSVMQEDFLSVPSSQVLLYIMSKKVFNLYIYIMCEMLLNPKCCFSGVLKPAVICI